MSGNFVGLPPGQGAITNFEGFASYESTSGFMMSTIVGTSGWDGTTTSSQFFSATVPAVPDNQLAALSPNYLAYCIPFFNDGDHPDTQGLGYRTKIVISNFDTASSNFTFEYLVNPHYPAQNPYTFTKTVAGRRQLVFDLYGALLGAGYPANTNSEGRLKISVSPAVRGLVLAFNTSTNADKFGEGEIQNTINPVV